MLRSWEQLTKKIRDNIMLGTRSQMSRKWLYLWTYTWSHLPYCTRIAKSKETEEFRERVLLVQISSDDKQEHRSGSIAYFKHVFKEVRFWSLSRRRKHAIRFRNHWTVLFNISVLKIRLELQSRATKWTFTYRSSPSKPIRKEDVEIEWVAKRNKLYSHWKVNGRFR